MKILFMLLGLLLVGCSTVEFEQREKSHAVNDIALLPNIAWIKPEVPYKPRIRLKKSPTPDVAATLSDMDVRKVINVYHTAVDRTHDTNQLYETANSIIDERNALHAVASTVEEKYNQCVIDLDRHREKYEDALWWERAQSTVLQALLLVGGIVLIL